MPDTIETIPLLVQQPQQYVRANQWFALLREEIVAIKTTLTTNPPSHAASHATGGTDPITPSAIGALPASSAGGSNVLLVPNATAPGSNPSGGGYLYSEGGSLKYKGSSGTVTVIANA